ncbi:hypothetical protein BJX99DRAFT_221015 [Aspergillus californicus]
MASITVIADSHVPSLPTKGIYTETKAVSELSELEGEDGDGNRIHAHSDNETLITSPYTTAEHFLTLSTLDKSNQLLARALKTLTPIRPDYATAPYTESFNWNTVFETLHTLAREEKYPWTTKSFYVVVFRSILRADADIDKLSLLDERSHAEAVASGGLLKYWFGVKNEKTRENLATCMSPP